MQLRLSPSDPIKNSSLSEKIVWDLGIKSANKIGSNSEYIEGKAKSWDDKFRKKNFYKQSLKELRKEKIRIKVTIKIWQFYEGSEKSEWKISFGI